MAIPRSFLLLALVAACDRAPPRTEPARSVPTAASRPAAPSRLVDAGAALEQPSRADPRLEFRETADVVAARLGCRITAWGTALLSDDGVPRAFAVLAPDEPGQGRGAYLIEDAADARWLVSFAVDGRTLPWTFEPGEVDEQAPRWQARPDVAIEHAQAHPHGGEELVFALRGGTLVVLAHDYTGDADSEVTERQRFAEDGACHGRCPLLRDLETEDFDLQVVGPAASVQQLLGPLG